MVNITQQIRELRVGSSLDLDIRRQNINTYLARTGTQAIVEKTETGYKITKVISLICRQCGVEWSSTIANPLRCKECNSESWDTQKDHCKTCSCFKKKELSTKEDKLSGLRDLMNKIPPSGENPVKVIKTEEDWRFTKEKPQYHEDGNVYRTQALAPDFKRTRVVQVDELDHNLIIRIFG